MSEQNAPRPDELVVEPHDGDLEAFWTRARTVAKLNPLEVVIGQDDMSSLRPSAFSFGLDVAQANELCELVLAGAKTATSSWAPLYKVEDAELPTIGELAIVCDGAGRPRALIRNTDVRLTPFCEVGEDIAAAEGEGPLDKWQREHDEFFRIECGEAGIEFNPDDEVVTEFFEVIYKH
ncbi:ASCH domain-containing protein [Arcanobacterium haemolyticum]|nr:ASCH domain-containing protein [Arcanobacterium haemolyticum]